MADPIRELKIRAEILHGRLAAGDPAARSRLRALAELRRAGDDELAAAASTYRLKHCLAVVAREHGFSSWEHARRVLEGDAGEGDFGTMLYDTRSIGERLNIWFADYGEARACLDDARAAGSRRYLLAYRRQFFIVEPSFVEALGLDPFDADWDAIAFD